MYFSKASLRSSARSGCSNFCDQQLRDSLQVDIDIQDDAAITPPGTVFESTFSVALSDRHEMNMVRFSLNVASRVTESYARICATYFLSSAPCAAHHPFLPKGRKGVAQWRKAILRHLFAPPPNRWRSLLPQALLCCDTSFCATLKKEVRSAFVFIGQKGGAALCRRHFLHVLRHPPKRDPERWRSSFPLLGGLHVERFPRHGNARP